MSKITYIQSIGAIIDVLHINKEQRKYLGSLVHYNSTWQFRGSQTNLLTAAELKDIVKTLNRKNQKSNSKTESD